MAIPSRQIGWGTQANLLWQISKQLERLICVASCKCPSTTTTTTTIEPTTTTTTTVINSFCYTIECSGSFEFSYILPDGTPSGIISSRATTVTFCAQENSVNASSTSPLTITGGTSICFSDGDCEVVVNTNYTFVNCPGDCGFGCPGPLDYFNVWMTQSCIDSWPTIGCEVWLDEARTLPFPSGDYNNSGTGCITITDGVVTAIP